MIKAFKLYIEPDNNEDDLLLSNEQRRIKSKNKQKQITYGMKLFIKYFSNLWY